MRPRSIPRWFMPLALLAAGAMTVWLAPGERSLGDGIRWVYIHVGLVWAGTLALAIAGLAGLVAAGTALAQIDRWVRATWRIGFVVFALGIFFSMVAARVNWGAVFFAEPRMAASLRFLAIAAIAQVLATWIGRRRVTGLLAAATFGLLLWDVGGARLVMHPYDPVRTASSAAIQWTFAASFVWAAALTAYGTLLLRSRLPGARP